MIEKMDALKEMACRVVETAKKGGAHTADVHIAQQNEFEAEIRKGEIENLAEAESFSISLTVSIDGKRASTQGCDLSEDGLNELVSQALTLCRYTDKDSFYSLPDESRLATEFPDLDLFDESLVALAAPQKIEWLRALEQELIRQDPRLQCDGASIASVYGIKAQANSLGFCGAERKSLIEMGAAAFAEDAVDEGDLNRGRKQMGAWASRARHVADLDDIAVIAQRTARQVLRKLGGHKPQTGNFPVYFEPSAARSLWGHLMSAISGSNIYRNESYLTDRLQSEVASKLITLTDQPRLVRGLGSRNFDSEGVACKEQVLVDKGILQTYLLGTYSANKLGMQSTGHAGGYTNLVITPGDLSEEEMLKKMGTGVWVTSLLGQGTNISTGDYSRGAQGLWVENGEVVHPVAEFTLNGNLDQMMRNIVYLGSNVEGKRSILSPGFVIGEMTISGN